MRRQLAVTAVAVCGGVLVAGGLAYAAIPAPDGTINGCYTTSNPVLGPPRGSLRVIDEGQQCRSNERALPWNQQGPKGDPGDPGDAGDAGPAGEQGPAGERGPSDTYVGNSEDLIAFSDGQTRTFASVPVPAGDYTVHAVLQVDNAVENPDGTVSFSQGSGICHVSPYRGNRNASVVFSAGERGRESLTILETVRVPSSATQTISLTCSSSGKFRMFEATLFATKVGALHE